jgi:hypothetical protein
MALRRYFACDVSEQIALRRKEDQEGPSLGLALGFDAQRVSGCVRSLPKFQSELPMPPSPPRDIKHYYFNMHQHASRQSNSTTSLVSSTFLLT